MSMKSEALAEGGTPTYVTRHTPAQARPGPDGPAGAPPGQRLRSGALIGQRENRDQEQDPYYKVSTVRGEPPFWAWLDVARPIRVLVVLW
jgi:hypothetical protein